jgi:hypothetical protein
LIANGKAPAVDYGIRPRDDGRFEIVWKTAPTTGEVEAEIVTAATTSSFQSLAGALISAIGTRRAQNAALGLDRRDPGSPVDPICFDSIKNVVEDPRVALIFLVPGANVARNSFPRSVDLAVE